MYEIAVEIASLKTFKPSEILSDTQKYCFIKANKSAFS